MDNDHFAGFSNKLSYGSEESISNMNRDYTSEFTTNQIFENREDMLNWAKRVGLENGIVVVINFNLEDRRGRMRRFTCETKSFTHLMITQINQRVETDIDCHNLPHILYEDEDHDEVVLASDSDLVAALDHASLVGLKSLRLHLDYSGARDRRGASGAEIQVYVQTDACASAFSAVAAALTAGIGVLAYLEKFSN